VIYLRPVFAKSALFDPNGLPLISVKNRRVLLGLEVKILGFDAVLCMEPLHKGLGPGETLYRPRQRRYVELQSPNRVAAIHFGWEEAPPTFAGKTPYGYRRYESLDIPSSLSKRIEATAQHGRGGVGRHSDRTRTKGNR